MGVWHTLRFDAENRTTLWRSRFDLRANHGWRCFPQVRTDQIARCRRACFGERNEIQLRNVNLGGVQFDELTKRVTVGVLPRFHESHRGKSPVADLAQGSIRMAVNPENDCVKSSGRDSRRAVRRAADENLPGSTTDILSVAFFRRTRSPSYGKRPFAAGLITFSFHRERELIRGGQCLRLHDFAHHDFAKF